MAKASMIAVAALLFAVCRLGAAAPNDEQALVQRGAFVTQEKEINVEGHKMTRAMRARMAFAREVRDFTDKIKETLIKRQANPTFGERGTLCTHEQEAEFAAATEGYEKLKTDGFQAYSTHFVNRSTEIVKILLDPLIAAGNVMLEDTKKKVTAPMRDILKYFVIKALKPHEKYAAEEVVPALKTSEAELVRFLQEATLSSREIISKSWIELDELLTNVAKEMEMPTEEFRVPMDKKPVINWEANTSNLPDYFATKALPIIVMEIFPRLANPISRLAGILPAVFENPDVALGAGFEVFAVVGQLVNAYDADLDAFLPNKTLEPQRICRSCKETYDDALATIGDGGCAGFCLGVFNQCASSVDKECVRSAQSCLACQAEQLAKFDNCTGVPKNEKWVQRMEFVGKHLKKAGTERGFDNFLGNMSMLVIKGDDYMLYGS